MKILLHHSGKSFLVRDLQKDFHCQFGFVKQSDLKINGQVATNTGEPLIVVNPSFRDLYKKIKRKAQVIPPKDIGLIITECGISKKSIVIEAGAGSGGLGCFLSGIVKKIYSYEIREDFFDVVKKNIDFLGSKNHVLKLHDAKLGFKEKDVDVVILDLPDPWELLDQAKDALKMGGILVTYSPTIPQVMDVVEHLKPHFVGIKTSEIIERVWEVKGRKVRPQSQPIGHSGFLVFSRKIQ